MIRNESMIGAKQDQLDDYLNTQLDALQAQMNALSGKIEQQKVRLTSHINKSNHKEVYAE